MSIPLLDPAVAAVYPLVAHVAALFGPIGGAATAIVVCTAALRLLLHPLTRAAVRGERARAALAPRMAELQRRHAKDPSKLRAELTNLYRDAGTSPLAGCLPALAQSPVFLVWYRIFTAPAIAGQPNALLSHGFLGAPLATHLIGAHALVFVPLLAILAVVAVVTMRRTRRIAAATGAATPPWPLLALPFASLVSAAFLPLAAVLYLATTMTWTAVENAALRRGLPAR